MNYITLINRFWQCDMERPIGATDTRLYFFLLSTCNALGWKMPFGHSDRFLSAKLGFSVNTVRDAADRLADRKLITLHLPAAASRSIEGQTKYSFPTVSTDDTDVNTVRRNKKTKTVSGTVSTNNTDTDTDGQAGKTGTDAGTVSTTVSGTVSTTDTESDTNTKQEKTKLNISDAIASGAGGEKGNGEKGKEKKPSAQKKEKSPPENVTPHWQGMVECWFSFNRDHLNGFEPSFKGSDPKELKEICDRLQKRAETSGKEWNEEMAVSTLKAFLTFAFGMEWLKKNFLLMNLNRQFDSIIIDAGKQQSNSKSRSVASAFETIDAMPG